MREQFRKWLANKNRFSDATVGKYAGGVFTISQEMLDLNVIGKPISEMSTWELDLAIGFILKNEAFILKNRTGNNMYSNALKQYRYFIHDTVDKLQEDIIIEAKNETEKISLVKSRVGQGQYRKDLMEKYQGQCVITGINLPKLLTASHIKPWSVSNNEERLDVENGFLLSSNLDKLFDSGLMSFKKDGKMMLSSFVGKENEQKLHISKDIVVDLKATSQLLEYLEYHRDVLFVK